MGILKGHFDKICKDAITRFAKKYNAELKDIQLLFYLKRIAKDEIPVTDEAGNELWEDAYKILHCHKVVENPTTKQLLGIKVDFTGKSNLISAQATMIMVELAGTFQIEHSAIRIMIYLQNDNNVVAHLYNGAQPHSKVNLEELLDDIKFMQT